MFNSQNSIDFLNTATASHLQNLKRQATNSKKLNHTSTAFELNHIANTHGFSNWALLVKAFNHKYNTRTVTFYDSLCNDELFEHIGHTNEGLVLIGGCSGIGKTTLIKQITDYLITHVPKQIVSICPRWDMSLVTSLPSVRKGMLVEMDVRDSDATSMIKQLRSAQRMDPDIIIISELVNANFIDAVCDAVQTGFMVIAGVPMSGMQNMNVYDHPDPCLEQLKQWAPDTKDLDKVVVASVNIGLTKSDIPNTRSKRIYACKLYNK